jgi:hypothetical protein
MRVPDTQPRWMLNSPKPKFEARMFNSKEFLGWFGRASLDNLAGWVDNPRIDTPVENWKDEHAGRVPEDDDLMNIMLDVSVSNDRVEDQEEGEDDVDSRRSRRNKLVELAENIRLNGIRVPLVLTYDKRIIDGNRRYFAMRYLYDQTQTDDERETFSDFPVWVLPKSATKKDEDRILTELNSINDCYVKWPYSVTAKRVYKDHMGGLSIDDLVRKYHDWTKTRIHNVIEAWKVAAEFIEYHNESVDARDLAYRKLVWFDELRRSNQRSMEKEPFRKAIFELMLDENCPFTSHAHFKRLDEIYSNSEAWDILTKGGKNAVRRAQFVVDRDQFEGKGDVQSRLIRINASLNEMVGTAGLKSVNPDSLIAFHSLADQVPFPRNAPQKAERLVSILANLTSSEISRLPQPLIGQLGKALECVKKQAASYKA